jgi:hypothetical protein
MLWTKGQSKRLALDGNHVLVKVLFSYKYANCSDCMLSSIIARMRYLLFGLFISFIRCIIVRNCLARKSMCCLLLYRYDLFVFRVRSIVFVPVRQSYRL